MDAADRAIAAGMPFNRFVTILWERGGLPPQSIAALNGAFVKLLADWLRARGYRLAWVWVQEASKANNGHVHLLFHVPAQLDPLFRVMPFHWVKGLLGRKPYSRGILQTQRIVGASALPLSEALYRKELRRKIKYVLKGCDHATGRTLKLPRFGEGGWVYGKRSGVWQVPRSPLK
jgi:hypothetical protein